jgi:hypothetical protein
MIVADTSVWVGFFNGFESPQVAALRRAIAGAEVIMGDLILAEILQGFRSDNSYRAVRQRLLALDIVTLCGRDVALEVADNYCNLRARGVTVRKTVDMIIATYCIRHALPLLHRDRDFDAMEKHLGLKVVRER